MTDEPAEGLCMARPGEPCSDPVTHHHVTSAEGRYPGPRGYERMVATRLALVGAEVEKLSDDEIDEEIRAYRRERSQREASDAVPSRPRRTIDEEAAAPAAPEFYAEWHRNNISDPAPAPAAFVEDWSDPAMDVYNAAPAEGRTDVLSALDVEHPDCGDRCACYVRGVDDEAEATRD